MQETRPLAVLFYRSERGREPVREWLKNLSAENRKSIGEDIKTAQFGWPLGMPLIRKLEKDLWEVRSRLSDGIARIILTKHGAELVLLHGFIKKTQQIPGHELAMARKRLTKIKAGGKDE